MIDIKDKVILVINLEQGIQVIEYLKWKGLINTFDWTGAGEGFYYGEYAGRIYIWGKDKLPTSKTILNWADCLAEWKPDSSKPKELSMPGNPITLIEPTEMEVSDDGEDWKKDTIYARYNGNIYYRFIGKKRAYKFARPIQPVTISLKEALQHLADKLNVSPEQIKIEG